MPIFIYQRMCIISIGLHIWEHLVKKKRPPACPLVGETHCFIQCALQLNHEGHHKKHTFFFIILNVFKYFFNIKFQIILKIKILNKMHLSCKNQILSIILITHLNKFQKI